MQDIWAIVIGGLSWLSTSFIDFYSWVLAQQAHLTLLATALAIIGGTWTLHKILISWNVTRRKLFAAYLNDELAGIQERKSQVASTFQKPSQIDNRISLPDINARINRAIHHFDKGRLEKAQEELQGLNSTLVDRSDFAKRQMQLADSQRAAVHLFLGSLWVAKKEHGKAIAEFQKTLTLRSLDLDALKYVAEQYLALCRKNGPDERDGFATSATAAANDYLAAAQQPGGPPASDMLCRQADAHRLLATAYGIVGNPDYVRDHAKAGFDLLGSPDESHELVATLRFLHGCGNLIRGNPARPTAAESFGIGAERYKKADLPKHAARMLKLKALAENGGMASRDEYLQLHAE